jgi:hypothetical protein
LSGLLGNPGWGKTILAGATIDELLSSGSADPEMPSTVCYYFFTQDSAGKATRIDAYRALAAQIFQQCHDIEEIHSIFSIANDGLKMPATANEILDLLKICLPLLPKSYFIIDGIDECIDNSKLVRDLSELCQSSQLKVALFSRPNVAVLRRTMDDHRTIALSRGVLSQDIALYLTREIGEFQESCLLPADLEAAPVVESLIERADGMFLWARLMMAYLNSPALTPKQRIETILDTTPEGLDEMYHRIVGLIKHLDQPSQQLARRVFTWVAYARSSLNPQQLHEAVYPGDPDSDQYSRLVDVDHAIIVSCCGLIEKRQNSTLRFIHLTARQFILSSSLEAQGTVSFIAPKSEAEIDMTKRCLEYLMFSVPLQPLSGNLTQSASRELIDQRLPLLIYAAPHWTEHFEVAVDESEDTRDLFELVAKFLTMKLSLMVWVEALYTFSNCYISSCISRIQRLGIALHDRYDSSLKLSIKTLANDISEFAADLANLHNAWHETLTLTPHEIWGDVTLFTPSRFFVGTSASSLEDLAPKADRGVGDDSRPMFAISANSRDGQRIAILSIWPSG